MALQATPYRFSVQLAHVDRALYVDLDVKMARHPSETERSLLLRLLAYCLLHEEGISFSKGGLSSPDEPALSVRTLDGRLTTWVEIGSPSGERLHKAAKAAPRVVLFTHADPALLVGALAKEKIHKRELIEVWHLAPAFLDELAAQVGDRGARLELTITEGQLFVGVGGATITGALERVALAHE
ncbi:MAG: YaeQ family protein [Deltaproteobacteria bacterium]|nr:YaeQ family protein [Deltaproteobacteria bacterium]